MIIRTFPVPPPVFRRQGKTIIAITLCGLYVFFPPVVKKFLAKSLSLVNILANKELVPEFMPYFSSITPILAAIELLLKDSDKLAQTSDAIIHLAEPFTWKKASKEVARIVAEMLR